MVSRLGFGLILSMLVGTTGCFQDAAPAPTMFGIYKLEISDASIHHGVDILVLNSDGTYVHLYTHGSSGKDLVQSGTWNDARFNKFVAWDLYSPLADGIMYPDPANTQLSFEQDLNGNYEIVVDPDRGEKFIQVDRFEK